jgi:leucyl aminopeptidase
MKINFSSTAKGITIKGVFENEKVAELSVEPFKGKDGDFILKSNVLYAGLGKKEEFNDEKARRIASSAGLFLRDRNYTAFSIVPFSGKIEATTEGMMLGLYQFLEFKTQKLDEIKKVEEITIVGNASDQEKFERTKKIAEFVYMVRDLQNNPGNVATPAYLAEKAKDLAKKYKLTCTVFDKHEMEKKNMRGILSVSKGSTQDPRLIVLEYVPKKVLKKICLVGKGVCFDSGGISLKPGDKMEEMKFDMSGAAAVMGCISAIAEFQLPYHVIAIAPCVENLPDGNSYKPGDIVKFMNGKTAEIVNTDAEGRVILGDALHYAALAKPDYIIDFATLTGACVVALGHYHAGIMGTDKDLIDNLFDAGQRTGEKLWELPLTDEYFDPIKSVIADFKNVGDGSAGTLTAAMFLKEFVGDYKWAHIDIAGTAWVTKDFPYRPVGGTGFGVRLIVDWLSQKTQK